MIVNCLLLLVTYAMLTVTVTLLTFCQYSILSILAELEWKGRNYRRVPFIVKVHMFGLTSSTQFTKTFIKTLQIITFFLFMYNSHMIRLEIPNIIYIVMFTSDKSV